MNKTTIASIFLIMSNMCLAADKAPFIIDESKQSQAVELTSSLSKDSQLLAKFFTKANEITCPKSIAAIVAAVPKGLTRKQMFAVVDVEVESRLEKFLLDRGEEPKTAQMMAAVYVHNQKDRYLARDEITDCCAIL